MSNRGFSLSGLNRDCREERLGDRVGVVLYWFYSRLRNWGFYVLMYSLFLVEDCFWGYEFFGMFYVFRACGLSMLLCLERVFR